MADNPNNNDLSFPTVSDAEMYAKGAGFSIENGMATRKDMEDVTFTLIRRKDGRVFWRKDD